MNTLQWGAYSAPQTSYLVSIGPLRDRRDGKTGGRQGRRKGWESRSGEISPWLLGINAPAYTTGVVGELHLEKIQPVKCKLETWNFPVILHRVNACICVHVDSPRDIKVFRMDFNEIWFAGKQDTWLVPYTRTYSLSQKNPPPCGFLTFFPKRTGIFNQFLHTYYTFLSTLDNKFLFNYLQLWRSNAILSANTQRIFAFHYKFNFWVCLLSKCHCWRHVISDMFVDIIEVFTL